ncbi:MAG: peptidase E [Chlamydiales bacterium]|nr:peptidase E [Chlamydiales bacterium]
MSLAAKQIIAHGGCGFSSPQSKQIIEKYILAQSGKDNPRISFLPQASSESQEYVAKFFDVFCSLEAKPSWVSLFGRVESSWKEKLLQQDIIYVGGGNTKSMLALWREWGVDKVLKEAYNRGIILAGVSAGAICWFEAGITDSVWPLGHVEALGFLPGTMCPHFDSEIERQEVFANMVRDKTVPSGIALEDHTAAHYKEGALFQVVTAVDGKKAYQVTASGQKTLTPILL